MKDTFQTGPTVNVSFGLPLKMNFAWMELRVQAFALKKYDLADRCPFRSLLGQVRIYKMS